MATVAVVFKSQSYFLFNFLSILDKLDKVIDDAEKTESMVNQVLYRTFTKQQGSNKTLLLTGPKVL